MAGTCRQAATANSAALFPTGQSRRTHMSANHASPVSPDAIRRSLEGADAAALAGFYAADATLSVIDRDHPPSAPQQLRGRNAIGAFYEDICGRTMTHHVDEIVRDGD